METSLRLVSRKGFMAQSMNAKNIKSYAHARKLGPFVAVDGTPVYWKNWSKKKTTSGKPRVAHFCKYPSGRVKGVPQQLDLNEINDVSTLSESPVHEKARIELTAYLQSVLEKGGEVKWGFKDDFSDYALSGNLLEGVTRIETEYVYKVKEFGLEFKYDIALLGPAINKEPVVMSAIEIEKSHRFGPLKLLASKCLSFPLMSINIRGLKEDDIDLKWCERSVTETKKNSEDSLRRNYMYLHDMLIPFYLDIPTKYQPNQKHALIIFAKSEGHNQLLNYLQKFKTRLGFSTQDKIHIDNVKLNPNNPDSVKMIQNEGSIAGAQWESYNQNRYIRVTLTTVAKKSGQLLMFSHVLARLVNTFADAIVGYKMTKGLRNENPDNHYWLDYENKKIGPKTLSEPLFPILEHFREWGIIERLQKSKGLTIS